MTEYGERKAAQQARFRVSVLRSLCSLVRIRCKYQFEAEEAGVRRDASSPEFWASEGDPRRRRGIICPPPSVLGSSLSDIVKRKHIWSKGRVWRDADEALSAKARPTRAFSRVPMLDRRGSRMCLKQNGLFES
jgi:hypothetical protein